MNKRIVAVGGGLATQRFCEALRRRGYEGLLTVVSDEQIVPYDRPPLSKRFLLGELDASDISLRDEDWYHENDVELVLADRATALDPVARTVSLTSGRALDYDKLLIATGSSARRMPQAEGFENVHYLRSLNDAHRLRAALLPGSRLAIVGAGFIGQEVAASARKLGVEVTIVEVMAAPLQRILGAQIGSWFAQLHREQGVELALGVSIAAFCGDRSVRKLKLEDGREIECDAVLIGVGVEPATRWLKGSGLPDSGVPVDAAGRTPIDNVYAAGDAALTYDPTKGGHVRTEHWESAARQGGAAALAALELEPRSMPSPASFWSDLYGTRIQHLGDCAHAAKVEIDGTPADRDFAAIYRQEDGTPVAALLVGRPHQLPNMRRLLTVQPADNPEPGVETHATNRDPLPAASR